MQPFLSIVLASILLPAAAPAQVNPAPPGGLPVARPDLTDLRPSEEPAIPTFAPYVEGDEDLGVQRLLGTPPAYRPWKFQGASGLYWTDNAALTEANKIDDAYLNVFLRADYLPKLGETLLGSFYTSYDFFRYDQASLLDFDDLQSGVGLAAMLEDFSDLALYGRYNYQRITETVNHTEIYTNHSAVLGLHKTCDLNSDTLAYARIESDLGFATNPAALRRNEYGLTLGCRYSPRPKIAIDAFYRLRFFDYANVDGGDWNHLPGLGISYDFNERLRFAASAYWVFNDSSRLIGDYTAANLGGFLSLHFSF